jgi:hypothetical protein
MEPAAPGGAPRVRLAKYGAELELPGCLDLAQVLERMILRVPQTVKRAWKAARPKTTGMTLPVPRQDRHCDYVRPRLLQSAENQRQYRVRRPECRHQAGERARLARHLHGL